MNVPTKLGFVFEDTVYLSDSFALLKDKCLELGAHRVNSEVDTGRDLRDIILPVTPELLTAFLSDFNVIELPEAETFGLPIPRWDDEDNPGDVFPDKTPETEWTGTPVEIGSRVTTPFDGAGEIRELDQQHVRVALDDEAGDKWYTADILESEEAAAVIGTESDERDEYADLLDSMGPLPADTFYFCVNVETGNRKALIARRIFATLAAGRSVRLLPPCSSSLRSEAFYVTTPEVDA